MASKQAMIQPTTHWPARAMVKCLRAIALGTLLTVFLSSCSCATEWSLQTEPPVVAGWFRSASLKEARIAATCAGDDAAGNLPQPEFADLVAGSLQNVLDRSTLVGISPPDSVPSIQVCLQAAQGATCDWLAVVQLGNVDRRQYLETAEEMDDAGKVITETSYVSATTVVASLDLFRVSDGARAFHVSGSRTRADSNAEDDDYGGFPNWLLLGLFASAHHPPFPDAAPIANDLAIDLIKVLRAVE